MSSLGWTDGPPAICPLRVANSSVELQESRLEPGVSPGAENPSPMTDTPEFAHLRGGTNHDLREALTLAKGWLEAVLKNWVTLDDQERQAMIAAALFGANRVGFVLDVM